MRNRFPDIEKPAAMRAFLFLSGRLHRSPQAVRASVQAWNRRSG